MPGGHMDLQLLRQIDLFESLDPIHIAHLASIITERPEPKGKVLFEEGDQGAEIYIIAEGKVRISKMIPGMGEEALAILPSQSYFGEMEFVDRDLRRAARATVHESAVLYCMSYSGLDDMLGADRDMALALTTALLRTFSRRLRATNDKLGAMFAMAQFS